MNHEDTLKRTVLPAIIALAALMLFMVHPVRPDVLVGAGTVLFLLAIAALEYTPFVKRLLRFDR